MIIYWCLQCVVTHVTNRIDSVAGIVLRAIFDASRRNETTVIMEKTGTISSLLFLENNNILYL